MTPESAPPLLPVPLVGGSGTRLWPQSRRSYPKQFVPLPAGGSLFQATVKRLGGFAHADPLVASNEAYRFLVAEELRRAGAARAHTLLERIEVQSGAYPGEDGSVRFEDQYGR